MEKKTTFKHLLCCSFVLCLLVAIMFTSYSSICCLTFESVSHYHAGIDVAKLAEIEEKYKSDDFALFADNKAPEDELNTNFTSNDVNCIDKDYYPETTFNINTYFQNLSIFSAYNNIGSCGYVSLIQLLSFYDTFYNDSIIPEQYESKSASATTEEWAKFQSPGVLRQSYSSSGYNSYYEYCNATMYSDFQSRLTVINNILENTNVNEKNNKGEDIFQYSIEAWDYQNVLNNLYGNTSTVKVSVYRGRTQTEFTEIIKDVIDSENPVIVHIKKYDDNGNEIGYHSVVAYLYDENGIYANFGWDSYANKYLLLGGDAGYSEIDTVATLDFSALGHSHSNNYIINSKTYCGCNVSDELIFTVSPSWKNIPPTFYWMKNSYDEEETYQISFKKSENGESIVSYMASLNQITIAVNAWTNILNQSNGTIYIEFRRNGSIVNYNSVTYAYNINARSMDKISLSPAEYGFDGRYYFETEGIKQKDIIQGDYTIGTTRLRCGYIENEYIVLSARRNDAHTAFLEYSFDTNVYRIDVDLTLWSNKELINKYNATAYIQYKDNTGQWITVVDLLNDITLSTDRTAPDNYTIVFPEVTTEFRFYTTSEFGSDRNKGRICIGDMIIYLEA